MSNKAILIGILGWLVLGSPLAWANKNRPYADPQRGYNIKEDERPWFDGKDYAYFREMNDGVSLKSQEKGSYTQFPQNSVPVRFVLGKLEKVYEAFVPVDERAGRPENQTEATAESLANGRVMYDTYCAVCHGKDGKAITPVTLKGVPAPPLLAFLSLPDAYLYNKIRYGSFYQEPKGRMPAYGGYTSRQDRWNIVNYLKSQEFGQ
ncbi:cytochrome c [Deltaproteobacteria bacterium TL4]